MSELDSVFEHYPNKIKELALFQADAPGFVYALDRHAISEPDSNNDVKVEYCAFYDTKAQNCSVYEYRPFVCSTFGDKKYNACPYDGYDEVSLVDLIINNRALATRLHGEAETHPMNILEEYIQPYIKLFTDHAKVDPEFMTVWESLPKINFKKE